MNHLVDPSLHLWGWEIAVYLFIGGLVAGMMILTGYFILADKRVKEDSVILHLPVFGIIFLSIGMFALFLDLEYKVHVWRVYTTFQLTSPMSWGSWILLLIYPLLFISIFLDKRSILSVLFQRLAKFSDYIHAAPQRIHFIGYANLAMGIMLGIYTGVLLSSLGARPLWNSSVLWLLFLVSGFSSAAAFWHMAAKEDEANRLLLLDNIALGLELLVLAMLIIGAVSSTQAHRNAILLLISGDYAPAFWTFAVIVGIIVPLCLQILQMKGKFKHTVFAPFMVLFGGLSLRFIIVYAGQSSHWFQAIK
jgi:formate-dependent nitrite reductase membrane component NrfD